MTNIKCQFCNDHKKGWPLILASNEIVRACEECYESGNFHGTVDAN